MSGPAPWGLVLATIIVFAANYEGDTGRAIASGVACAALAAVLFVLVVPRTGRRHAVTLVLSLLAVASLAIYWSGVTPLLLAGAIGTIQRDPKRPSFWLAVVMLAAFLAMVAAFVLAVLDL